MSFVLGRLKRTNRRHFLVRESGGHEGVFDVGILVETVVRFEFSALPSGHKIDIHHSAGKNLSDIDRYNSKGLSSAQSK
ncbi:hypothetical protein P5G61_15885 [Paenibacillus sp. F6_3S_P_1C]|uniref:Uncharacterized protein n=1 Tax=Paenibacillus vandeheii TaxID=3035917 RepID=A0ABT8JC76_9BACL|nr:hypothetical protein [Paenibacillus vandeheii]MDN4602718.1 hypothetical protein [Paenibacillus vandeheii]